MSLIFNNSEKWLNRMVDDVRSSYPVPKRGGVCVDVGTNVGAFSIVNHSNFDKIYGFEPAYNSYLYAQEQLKKRNILNTKIFNLAVGAATGEIKELRYYPKDQNSGNCRTIPIPDYENRMKDSGRKEIVEHVLAISLDDIFNLIDVDIIDYMKIDIEGAEEEFLLGKNLSLIKYLAMEIHPWIDRELLVEYLLDSGFKIISSHNNLRYFFKNEIY